MVFFLAFDLSGTYTGRRSHAEESIPALPGALANAERSFFRNEGLPKYVPQVLSKYAHKTLFIMSSNQMSSRIEHSYMNVFK
jgi:hypothetical protein